jgi:plastocyanin
MMKSLLAFVLLLPVAAQEQQQTFTVRGTVSLNGPVPKAKLNKALAADPACAGCHLETPAKDDLVVSAAGGVRWAFVYVKKGLEGKTFTPPETPVLIDQVGCIYTPHMVGAVVGQTVNFKNSDKFLHNVHGLPFSNKEFNFSTGPGATVGTKFANSEVMVRVKCDVHPWMGSWIGVLDHPFFAVTDADGKFEIKGLPQGTYTLGVWHEGLSKPDRVIVVAGDRTEDFKLDP